MKYDLKILWKYPFVKSRVKRVDSQYAYLVDGKNNYIPLKRRDGLFSAIWKYCVYGEIMIVPLGGVYFRVKSLWNYDHVSNFFKYRLLEEEYNDVDFYVSDKPQKPTYNVYRPETLTKWGDHLTAKPFDDLESICVTYKKENDVSIDKLKITETELRDMCQCKSVIETAIKLNDGLKAARLNITIINEILRQRGLPSVELVNDEESLLFTFSTLH